MVPIDPSVQMWATFAVILAALALYLVERVPMEVTSLGVLCALMVMFHLMPVTNADGVNLLRAERLIQGFANPALLTVLGLLVIGEALVRTGTLDTAANLVYRLSGGSALAAIIVSLVFVLAISAFLNNIPVVVIFIPIMQTLSERIGRSPSKVMIPLSFAAVLGGMTTLIGSSTNLLVSSALIELGERPFGFFDFSVPGVAIALIGLGYVILVAPRLLTDRAAMAATLTGTEGGAGKQFVAQIEITPDSPLLGERAVGGFFKSLSHMTVKMVQREEHAFLPPFDDIALLQGDILVVAATRKVITEALSRNIAMLYPDLRDGRSPEEDEDSRWRDGNQSLAEVMVTPASAMIGRNLEQIGFRYQHHCIVLGIQRRARMIRERMTEIRLEAGDVLLIQGPPDDITALRHNRDVVLMEWSAKDLPHRRRARRAALIFVAVVVAAASGLLPIVTAAVGGAAAMIAVGALNIRQAGRAMDRQIIIMIPAALALGLAMQETGGAKYLSDLVTGNLMGAGPIAVLSGFFLLVAILANLISTKACAVLFTPIAVGIADGLNLDDPVPFAVAVVFAANCSFASPIGYQTNLLVMAPGHYKFVDFIRAGAPLIIVMWLAFTAVVPLYYGLW